MIFCDAKYPILWLEDVLKIAKNCLKTSVTIHRHSTNEKVSQFENFCADFKNLENEVSDLSVNFIWKSVGVDPILKLDGNREIFGQVNIARYMNRLIELINPSLLRYESKGPLYANKIDGALDKIHNSLHNSREKFFSDFAKSKSRFIFEELSIVDLIVKRR